MAANYKLKYGKQSTSTSGSLTTAYSLAHQIAERTGKSVKVFALVIRHPSDADWGIGKAQYKLHDIVVPGRSNPASVLPLSWKKAQVRRLPDGRVQVKIAGTRRGNPASASSLRDKAALSLDLTHHIGERGPKTFQARARVSEWLDGARGAAPRKDIAWLLRVAKKYGRR
jgi:hypothetical protein